MTQLHITANGGKPQERLCDCCGNDQFEILPGTGPHVAKETCLACGRFLRWISKREFAALISGGAE
jgi:hypothetical protein